MKMQQPEPIVIDDDDEEDGVLLAGVKQRQAHHKAGAGLAKQQAHPPGSPMSVDGRSDDEDPILSLLKGRRKSTSYQYDFGSDQPKEQHLAAGRAGHAAGAGAAGGSVRDVTPPRRHGVSGAAHATSGSGRTPQSPDSLLPPSDGRPRFKRAAIDDLMGQGHGFRSACKVRCGGVEG